MKTKEEYIEKLASELKEWSADIDLLTAKMGESAGMEKLKYLEDLNALHAILLAAAEKVQELENTGGDAWETAKDTTDKIWDDLRTGLAGAVFKFE
ncbi:coiled coil domain-containing protein [Methylomicrobium sp. Wu6]|uniref:coiled coil domain-containing protein n=1 Tax=Methylomicrobium sp. Wu6 TaxID=3107928 RepID=UPI002DD681BD|nr:coiled coil domain-containing protein [Methylomicrobium sp. Wu6]MEC4746864.1 coiled coil domain-containing protein [Methylomicrobium sp. Wu6]